MRIATKHKLGELAYEAAVTAWDIYLGLAPITVPVTLAVLSGLAFKVLGW